jgi:hypothetical protein
MVEWVGEVADYALPVVIRVGCHLEGHLSRQFLSNSVCKLRANPANVLVATVV